MFRIVDQCDTRMNNFKPDIVQTATKRVRRPLYQFVARPTVLVVLQVPVGNPRRIKLKHDFLSTSCLVFPFHMILHILQVDLCAKLPQSSSAQATFCKCPVGFIDSNSIIGSISVPYAFDVVLTFLAPTHMAQRKTI